MADSELNYSDWFQAKIKAIREQSGDVLTLDPLVHFLYIMMRDYTTVGVVEKIMEEMEWEVAQGKRFFNFTNGWLAQYAQNVTKRLCDIVEINFKYAEEQKCQTQNTTEDSQKPGKPTRRSTSKK